VAHGSPGKGSLKKGIHWQSPKNMDDRRRWMAIGHWHIRLSVKLGSYERVVVLYHDVEFARRVEGGQKAGFLGKP